MSPDGPGLRVGFGRGDITPRPPVGKLGYLKPVEGRRVAAPLHARALVCASDGGATATLVVLDTLSVPATLLGRVRSAIAAASGLAPHEIAVAATHNHAGPAVAALGTVAADEDAVVRCVRGAVAAVSEALAALGPAHVGFARGAETSIAANRRVVQRDGTVRTHGAPDDPEALFVEGPVDHAVSVLAFRTPDGEPLGLLAGFGCHPTHHGDDDVLSPGWPGALRDVIEAEGWPDAVFVNGAFGNVAPVMRSGAQLPIDLIAARLATAALRLVATAAYVPAAPVALARIPVELPFRAVSSDEAAGRARGAQRFIDPATYDTTNPALQARIADERVRRTEVQALRVGTTTLVTLPAEPFAELGLEILERAHPRDVVVVGAANGMVGYVPHAAAFARGGYETTFGMGSHMAPEAGALLVGAALSAVERCG